MPAAATPKCRTRLSRRALRTCRRFRCLAVGIIAWLWSVPTGVLGQPLTDQQMKAAFVLNFVRYTEWPEKSFAAPDAPMVVCVLGDPGATELSGVAGKTIKGHPLQVRAAISAEDARGCHALFIPEPDARRFIGTLRALQGAPVLTISEADGFIDIGGMIGLVHIDNRLQFEVNLGVIQQAQLKASSQLLRLARNVIEARPR